MWSVQECQFELFTFISICPIILIKTHDNSNHIVISNNIAWEIVRKLQYGEIICISRLEFILLSIRKFESKGGFLLNAI